MRALCISEETHLPLNTFPSRLSTFHFQLSTMGVHPRNEPHHQHLLPRPLEHDRGHRDHRRPACDGNRHHLGRAPPAGLLPGQARAQSSRPIRPAAAGGGHHQTLRQRRLGTAIRRQVHIHNRSGNPGRVGHHCIRGRAGNEGFRRLQLERWNTVLPGDDLSGRLQHDARRMGVERQVLSHRQPESGCPNDKLRTAAGPVARGRGAAGRVVKI